MVKYGVSSLEALHEMFDTFHESQPKEGFSKSSQGLVWLHMLQPIFYDIRRYPLES